MSASVEVPRVPRAPARRVPTGLDQHLADIETFFDAFASRAGEWRARNAGYYDAVTSLARFYVPPGARVLEIGCGGGDLLAALQPSAGVGVDVSSAMVARAQSRHPHLTFHHMAAERLTLPGQTFDYVILSDVIGYLYDIRAAIERTAAVSHPGTRIVLHWHSRVWQPIIRLLEWLGWKPTLPALNWTTVDDVENFLRLGGFERVRDRGHILVPAKLGRLGRVANRVFAYLPVVRAFVWTRWVVARPTPRPMPQPPRVSVICPCRNEKGNIEQVVRRLPDLGAHTELIFVEGHSRDGTLEECRRVAALYPHRDIKVFEQPGKGKGDAVRLGFARATGDLLMILDADLSVPPETLPDFYETAMARVGDCIIGSRLVYAMDSQAMRFVNLLGNRAFAVLLTRLVGQPIKDPLCGTKVLWREDYERLARGRAYFGDFDPFGDFDLIFGAAKLGLRIVEVPVRYRQRTYGAPNISRFADGWSLLKMCIHAAKRLFFVA